MKNYSKLFLFYLLGFNFVTAQIFTETELSINQHIEGTLLTPTDTESSPLIIFIGGSGPTDRDGNQSFMKNDMLKKLAVNLSNNGISTFRYDKRIVKQIRTNTIDKNISFDDFVTCYGFTDFDELYNLIDAQVPCTTAMFLRQITFLKT